VEKGNETVLLFRDVLTRLSLPADDQIRTKEPGVCLVCDLVNDYEDAGFTWVAMELSGDLERAWRDIGELLESLQEPDLACNDDEVVRRPAWRLVRESAAHALSLFRQQQAAFEQSQG
jgi:hypothetical protein